MRTYHRYNESPLNQTSIDLKQKKDINTHASFSGSVNKNPEADLLRLPALNSMNSMRRSSSLLGTDRNTKFRLQNLQEKLQELAAEVHNTRLEANQTLNTIRFLKESLAVNQLNKTREDLKKQIKGFERSVMAGKAADEQRSNIIRNDCNQLWNFTQSLRQTLFQLRMRTEQLDRSMGFQPNFD